MVETNNFPQGRFSRQCLQDSFQLLRDSRPALALQIQNCLVNDTDEEGFIAICFDTDTVVEIVDTLAELADMIAEDHSFDESELIAVRSVLMAWLVYAQSHA